MSATDKIKIDDLPNMPSDAGLYLLRAAIIDDELVYSWEELTTAEELEI